MTHNRLFRSKNLQTALYLLECQVLVEVTCRSSSREEVAASSDMVVNEVVRHVFLGAEVFQRI